MATATLTKETARFGGISFDEFSDLLRKMAANHNLDLSETAQGGLKCTTSLGSLDFAPEESAIRLDLAAPQEDFLQMLKTGMVENLANGLPAVAETLFWETPIKPGTLPANFRFITVRSVTAPARDFLRVRVTGEDLHGFAGERMHFRLVLPAEGDNDPLWPYLDETGRFGQAETRPCTARPIPPSPAIPQPGGWISISSNMMVGGSQNGPATVPKGQGLA